MVLPKVLGRAQEEAIDHVWAVLPYLLQVEKALFTSTPKHFKRQYLWRISGNIDNIFLPCIKKIEIIIKSVLYSVLLSDIIFFFMIWKERKEYFSLLYFYFWLPLLNCWFSLMVWINFPNSIPLVFIYFAIWDGLPIFQAQCLMLVLFCTFKDSTLCYFSSFCIYDYKLISFHCQKWILRIRHDDNSLSVLYYQCYTVL